MFKWVIALVLVFGGLSTFTLVADANGSGGDDKVAVANSDNGDQGGDIDNAPAADIDSGSSGINGSDGDFDEKAHAAVVRKAKRAEAAAARKAERAEAAAARKAARVEAAAARKAERTEARKAAREEAKETGDFYISGKIMYIVH